MLVDDPTFQGLREDRDDCWVTFANAVRSHLRGKTVERIPEAEADDILAEVFIRIYSHIDEVRDAHHLENFVWKVWRQRIVDWHRKRREPSAPVAAGQEEGEAAGGVAEEDLADGQLNPERLALLSEFRSSVRDSTWLTSRQKVIVLQHIFDSLAFACIARLLGLSPKTVESEYYRAIENLRKEAGLRQYNEDRPRLQALLSEQQRAGLDCLLDAMSEKKTAKKLGLSVPALAELLAPAFNTLAAEAKQEWQAILHVPGSFAGKQGHRS